MNQKQTHSFVTYEKNCHSRCIMKCLESTKNKPVICHISDSISPSWTLLLMLVSPYHILVYDFWCFFLLFSFFLHSHLSKWLTTAIMALFLFDKRVFKVEMEADSSVLLRDKCHRGWLCSSGHLITGLENLSLIQGSLTHSSTTFSAQIVLCFSHFLFSFFALSLSH